MKTFLFYFLSLTWGLPLTLFGAVIASVLLITGHRPRRWKKCIYFEVGESWGGLEMGLFFLTHKNADEHIKNHEYGHGIQNCILGPFMPFVISIPSAIRYHYKKHKHTKKGYYDIWFEKWANKLGGERK